jgi:5-methylcytosine-specific restriction endonuclease McrA
MQTVRVGGVDLEISDCTVALLPRKRRAGAISTTRTCPSCGTTWLAEGRPKAYCSLACTSTAKAIRYARKKTDEYRGRDLPADVRYAIRIKIALALSGGYDKAARNLTQEVRQTVIDRDRGLCVLCGQPWAEIDHIDGPNSNPSNLRLLCKQCHHGVTEAHLRPITDTATLELRDRLLRRIDAPEPERPCDQPGWDWRSWCAGPDIAPDAELRLDDDETEARGIDDGSGSGAGSRQAGW